MGETSRGHRVSPHTADVILDAWGPDLAACYEEAVAGLVETCAEADDAPVVEVRRRVLAPAPPEVQLLELLDEVIFVLDTAGTVPVGARVRVTDDGGLAVELHLADPGAVEQTGSVPKAVSRSRLSVDEGPDGSRCTFLVDV